jgi:Leucine-rich repeat (LRR) protein
MEEIHVWYAFPQLIMKNLPLLRTALLELSLNQISGSIPTAIQQLTSLEYLDVSFNELTGTIPSALGRLTSLQYLNLKSSELTGTIPSELGSLSQLGMY